MRVSVIICSWNRCASLRGTLDSLTAVSVPAEQSWEVIVVDNGSTDATGEVVSSFRKRLPIRAVREPQVGLSRARNTGVGAATGDLLLFTDDDVEVGPSWIGAYLTAAERWPGAGYFGGEIFPVFAPGVPAWMPRHADALAGMLCTRHLGEEARPLAAGEHPYGPNMAVRRAVFARASFDVLVGRVGKGQMRGSETSLFRVLERQGICGVWVPDARVGHHIPASRATLRYLWQYYHGSGRGGARLNPSPPGWRRQLSRSLRAAARLMRDRQEWPRHLAAVAKETGRLREALFPRRVESRVRQPESGETMTGMAP